MDAPSFFAILAKKQLKVIYLYIYSSTVKFKEVLYQKVEQFMMLQAGLPP